MLGIRPDGSFVRWQCEDDPGVVKPLSDPFWERMAICQGVKRYPELASLLPERPSEARECNSCKGTGRIEGLPQWCICASAGSAG